MYDPLGLDGAGSHVGGAIPVNNTDHGKTGGPVTNDDEPDYTQPVLDPTQDTGGGSFDGVPSEQVVINITADGRYAAQGPSGQITIIPLTGVDIDGIKADLPPSPSINWSLGNGYIENFGTTSSAPENTAGGGGASVSEVVVTAPRYDPCAGLSFNIDKLGSTSGEAIIPRDTQAEFAAQTYQQTDLGNIVVPAGYQLQNKLALVDSFGQSELVEVLQQVGHSNYVVSIEGTHSLGVFIEDIGLASAAVRLDDGGKTYIANIANFLQGVAATIHANDPGANVYISGHSFGGGAADVATEIFSLAGVPDSQLHTVSLAPVGAGAMFDYLGLARYGTWAGRINTYINQGDIFLPLMGTVFYGIVTFNGVRSTSEMNPDGTFNPSAADHDVCTYVRSISRP